MSDSVHLQRMSRDPAAADRIELLGLNSGGGCETRLSLTYQEARRIFTEGLHLCVAVEAEFSQRLAAQPAQSEEKAIQFFYFYDAPEWMREACSQGGDEDWIAVFPIGHHEAPKPGDRDVWCPYFRDCCSIDAVQLADGRMALVGTHA